MKNFIAGMYLRNRNSKFSFHTEKNEDKKISSLMTELISAKTRIRI